MYMCLNLLKACHLNTEISEKTGPVEISLKNVLENLEVYWSQITEGLECH